MITNGKLGFECNGRGLFEGVILHVDSRNGGDKVNLAKTAGHQAA